MPGKITTEQQEVILHPDRVRIVGQFVFGDALTASELHQRLPDLAIATLYRHLGLLTDAGVLAIQATQAKRGTSEKTYVIAVNVLFSIDQVMKFPGRLLQVAAIAATALIQCFTSYLQRANLSKRTVDPRMRFYPVYATDEEYRTLVEKVEKTLGDAIKARRSSPPSPSAQRRMFFLAAVPEFE